MQWAFRECLDHYAFQLKHGQTTCMDCGHTWTTDEDADKCVCPKCKAKLEVQRTKRQKAMSSTYFSVLTERKGLQLMRAYQMKAYYRKGQKADIYCWEVARYWMNEKGKVEVMARKRTMGIYMDTFCYDSDIELRKDNTTYQHIASFPVCPDMKVIPQIWRNGFDGAFHGIEPLTLFKAMLTDHRIETMMKQCSYRLFFIVCYHHDGASVFLIQLVQQFHHLSTHLRVQVTGRLIGEDYLRITNNGTGNSHTLALTTRELCRYVTHTVAQTHLRQHFFCQTAAFFGGHLSI